MALNTIRLILVIRNKSSTNKPNKTYLKYPDASFFSKTHYSNDISDLNKTHFFVSTNTDFVYAPALTCISKGVYRSVGTEPWQSGFTDEGRLNELFYEQFFIDERFRKLVTYALFRSQSERILSLEQKEFGVDLLKGLLETGAFFSPTF